MSDLGNRSVFSRNLRRQMEKNDVSRNDICKALGFKYSTFSDWINGNKYPRIDKIEMMANYFHIEKSDLIEDKQRILDEVGNLTATMDSFTPSEDELTLIRDYRDASDEIRSAAATMLHNSAETNRKEATSPAQTAG